jgi:hypothetical protein
LGITVVGVAALLLILIWTATGQSAVLVPAAGLVVIVIVLVVLIGQVNRARVDGAEAEHAAQQVLGACANLGHADTVVRVGGLHALGMIWRDWPREHDRIQGIVVAWLQDHARSGPTDTVDRPAPDVAAAVWELVRRPDRPERDPIDLAGCFLSDCDLRRARLASANLVGTVLNRAMLTDAVLTKADLTGADLSGANLRGAKLVGADVQDADFTGADLHQADLSHVDLMTTVGLTASQLKSAITDTSTRIPAEARESSPS